MLVSLNHAEELFCKKLSNPLPPHPLFPAHLFLGTSHRQIKHSFDWLVSTHLALIHYAAVWVDLDHIPTGVHALCVGWAPQPEGLAALQQDVQVVMVVMVQARRCTCRSPDRRRSKSRPCMCGTSERQAAVAQQARLLEGLLFIVMELPLSSVLSVSA